MNSDNRNKSFSSDLNVNILGHLFWYSIGHINITRQQLNELLDKSGFGEEWLPKPISKKDAFRRATNEIQNTKRMNKSNTHHNYLVRETYNDRTYTQRNIIIENIDQNEKDLQYNARAAIFYFDKQKGKFSYYNESGSVEVERICEETEETFNIYSRCYNGQHIRAIVLDILRTLTPVAMKREGYIYYIPVHLENRISGLTHFINLLGGNEAFQVPLIDTEDNRKILSQKIHDRYDYLLDKAAQDKSLRKDQLTSLVYEIRVITDDFRNLQRILDIPDDELEDKNRRLKYEIFRISK